MKLELKHLSAYLPYRLNTTYRLSEVINICLKKDEIRNKELNGNTFDFVLRYCKPILRPLSDLTKEIEVNKEKFIPINYNSFKHDKESIIEFKNNFYHYKSIKFGVIERLLEWHFDIFGLIENDLAIDINTLDDELETRK
jgi:hypothetical protein